MDNLTSACRFLQSIPPGSTVLGLNWPIKNFKIDTNALHLPVITVCRLELQRNTCFIFRGGL